MFFCEDLKAKMANSTEAEILSLQSYLQSLREDTNVDLRRNVFKKCVYIFAPERRRCIDGVYSYAEFMMISKEVSTLENDMLELKESLSEWKSMPSLLHINDAATLAGTSVLSDSVDCAQSSEMYSRPKTNCPFLRR